MRGMAWKASLLVALVLSRGAALAGTLVGQVSGLIPPKGILLSSVGHVAHFSSSTAATLPLLLGQMASSAADFPAISTAPGFTYRYNPDVKAFERTSGSLGAIFVDRADTIGAGKLDVGASYTYVSFDTFNGDDLNGLNFTLAHQHTAAHPAYEKDTLTITLNRFKVDSHVVSLFGTYGITDRLDVNLLVPVVQTSLVLDGSARINDISGLNFHQFANGKDATSLGHVSGAKLGFGDILLRSKYRLTDSSNYNLAAALTIRAPTGTEADFQGFGDVTVTPGLVGSIPIGPHDLHANLGIEADPENTERSRARYGIGGSFRVLDPLTAVVEIFGSSGLAQEHVSRDVPVVDNNGNPIDHRTETKATNFRTDIVNLALGAKVSPMSNVILFAAAILPVTSDGLRSDVIPTGGIEVSF